MMKYIEAYNGINFRTDSISICRKSNSLQI